MGLIADILKHQGRSYSNGGVSSKVDQVTIVNAPGPFEPTPDRPAVMLVYGNVPGSVKAVPAEEITPGVFVTGAASGAVGPMHGGTYIETSDSRFGETVESLGGPRYAPVAFHDRFETPAQYEALSA